MDVREELIFLIFEIRSLCAMVCVLFLTAVCDADADCLHGL